MRHPMNIRAESGDAQQTVPATAQFIYQVHDLDKPELVSRILQAENSGLTIVFTRTKRAAQRLADDLQERGFDASPLHGDMQQVSREKALKRFREGKLKVLVATDVAARGIDVADVTHVINYSCPEDEKTYVHRIGRTGRAGASGVAVTFVDWADVTRWKVINRQLDLPFDEVLETYSTSEHFFHDMGIAPGTKGRLVPEKPAEPRTSSSEGGRSGGRSGGSGSGDRPAADRPRRNRSRTRTRSGQPVDAAAPATASSASGAETEGDTQPAATRTRRRRRRSSGSKASSTPSE
jgi:superfamily II DNA/RNA helicase